VDIAKYSIYLKNIYRIEAGIDIMYIESISFFKKSTHSNGWKIEECQFNKINLITGKNSSGKTRLLKEAIYDLVGLISNTTARTKSGFNFHWKIKLKNEKTNYNYEIKIEDELIIFEKFEVDNEVYYERNKEGKGKIKYEPDKKVRNFEIDRNLLVINSKRDKIQHPILEVFLKWADFVYIYNFGDTLGRDRLILSELSDNKSELSKKISKDDNAVVLKFEEGLNEYGENFKQSIITDFNGIGYAIEDINTIKYDSFIKNLPNNIGISIPSVIYIKEKNIQDEILQKDISQGMFRVLSLIIQIKYIEYKIKNSDVLILIDDIGEGLDYERATKLIKYIINKIETLGNNIQLIMTTNDRFVMNNIPLKYWTIIDKNKNGKIEFYNEEKNKKIFNKFKRIGLNNFDFFTSEYYKK
jgi:hypothetical protein